MKIKLYQAISRKIIAYNNSVLNNNLEWAEKHKEEIDRLVNNYIPSGAGIDDGVSLDIESTSIHHIDKLVFESSFHYMNEDGFYEGWYDFSIVVTPSLPFNFNLHIIWSTEAPPNDFEDYLHDLFNEALDQKINS